MAKLSQYRSQVIAQQSTTGPAPVDTSMSRALGQAASGLSQVAQAKNVMMQREARDYTLESQNTTAVGLSAEKERLTTESSTGSEYLDGVKTYIDTQRTLAMDNAPTPKAAASVKEYYDKLESTELERAIPVASKMTATSTANAVRTNINILTNETYRDPASYAQNLEEGIKTILESDLAESLKPQAIDEYRNQLNVQRVQGMTSKAPSATLNQLESGQFDDLLTPQQLTSLTESARAQKAAQEKQVEINQRTAEAEANTQQEAKNAVLQSELEIGINRGEMGYAEIERAFDEGIITPEKRTQLTIKMDNKVDAQNKINLGIQGVSAAINGGQPLDHTNTDHKNAVDNYYQAMPDKSMSSILTLITSTKVIPSQVETSLNAGLRGNPEQRVEAAQTIALLNESSPESVATLSADTKAMGLGLAKLVAAGVNPGTASELMYNSVYNTSKEEKDVLKTQLTGKDLTNKKAGGFKKAVNKVSPSFFSPNRTPSMNSMEAEFNTAVNDYYLMTHDIETAMDLAATDISKVWGSTWVDGKERVMKYSPEKIYGNGKETPWIYEQLKTELKGIGVEGKHSLQADAISAREDRPSYTIMVEQDGVMMPFMIDGQIQRYTPDFSITENAKILEEQKVEAVERAKKKESILKNYGGEFPAPKFGNYGYEVN